MQKLTNQTYGRGFVDLGDITDLMHVHVIMRPKNDNFKIPKNMSLTKLSWTPDWEQVQEVGALFHTQEYSFMRKTPYIGPYGELDPIKRNWLLFLTDNKLGKKYQVVNAELLSDKKPQQNKTYTVNAEDINSSVFDFEIDDWQYSFYFFRITCQEANSSKFDGDNLIEVFNHTTNERICLALMSFHCRNYPDDKANCHGKSLKVWRPNE